MRRIELIALLTLLVLNACEKEEIPLRYEAEPLPQGTFTTQIEMTSNYRYRLYYDLESDSVVSKHIKTEWDISFSCDGSDRIGMNTSKFMSVWKVADTPIEDVTSFQGEGPLYDDSNGSINATEGWTTSDSYIVDRGFDENGQTLGYYIFQVTEVSEESYTLKYTPFLGTTILEVTIDKDATRNTVQFSFDEGVKLLEPPREDWDLLFTHYTYYFEEEDLPYLVSGVLLNPYLVQAQELDEYDFEQVDAEYLDNVTYTYDQDVIGFDWKTYILTDAVYIIEDNMFVIRTVDDNRYKLQFTGFVNEFGENGYPAFRAALVP